VLLSSHLLTDLGDVCDHLPLLGEGRVQVSGDIDEILTGHQLVVGPAGLDLPEDGVVVDSSHTPRQTTAFVRGGGAPSGWESTHPDLEALVMGYLRASRTRKLVRSR
jgi:ABC-2 type transport system ATP-binding protein